MAIDLPPVMPPQLASQIQIQANSSAQAASISAVIGGITVRVIGNQQLSNTQIEALLAEAETPSAAITSLTRRYYNAGHLLVSVSYYRLDDTVTVLVNQAVVKGLRGNPQVTAHFANLVGDPDLSLAEFDRARVLADLQAERAGLSYSIAYEQHYDNQVILDFREQVIAEHDATDFILEMNNKGSRFLGRYFGLAGFKHQFTSGTELNLAYKTIFESFGEAGDGDDYQQFDFTLEHPFTFGLYGVEASHIEYQRHPQVAASGIGGLCLPLLNSCLLSGAGETLFLDADIDSIAVSGEQVLYSNPVQRWTAFERIEHISSEIRSAAQSTPLLDENYDSLELGAKYSVRGSLADAPSYFKAQLSLKTGFGNGGSFASDNSDAVSIGKREAEFILLLPKLGYKFALAPDVELALNFSGQFADNTQLPQQQQFVLGGMNSMSAYLPGVMIGDNGYFAHVAVNGKHQWWGLAWESSLFGEYAATEFNNARGELAASQSLADAGFRLSLKPGYGLETELLAAVPVFDDVVDEPRLESLEADFFWRLRWVF
ncbi:MAG: hemin-binding protein [Zhongshania sp.]|uniref:hemin-binding protein n=1 Tax=Zhongshania sp. TaxID=1971902 RepID=UPI002618098F|nr:hemin-binding protein [Zhongshania sp.]MDF1692778.1 hemin-binding protein [Zhongshania sp.]